MKTRILLLTLQVISSTLVYSTVWTITNTGNTFSPNNLTIAEGDTVFFQLAGNHDVRQVSQATWDGNGTEALPGGFQTPLGGGTILPEQLPAGTHYYVCTPHASVGMKGTITVTPATNVEQINQKKIALYPNPSSGSITVELSGLQVETSFFVFDHAGRLCLNGILNPGKTHIDISHLSPGVYVLRIEDQIFEKRTFIRK